MGTKVGWVWVEKKGGFRPFTEFRQIQKGRDKGKVEITLPATPSRKVLVDPASIRSYPVAVGSLFAPGKEKDE